LKQLVTNSKLSRSKNDTWLQTFYFLFYKSRPTSLQVCHTKIVLYYSKIYTPLNWRWSKQHTN